MRAVVVAAMLLVMGTAWGQVSPAQISIIAVAGAQRRAIVATLCGLRDETWWRSVNGALINSQYQVAHDHLGEFDGDTQRAFAFITAAETQAKSDANYEVAHYGAVACRDLQTSGDLEKLDGIPR